MKTRFVFYLFGMLLVLFVLSGCANPTPVPTAVAVVPTATNVPPTATAIPPTATPIPTETPLPTNTPTNTPVPPTATATQVPPTATVPPPPTNTPLPRPTATLPRSPEMPASFNDTFDSPGFLRAASDDICSTTYEGGQFHFRVYKQNYFCWAVYPRAYSNFVLEVDVTMYSGEGSCGGGADILFGYKDRNNFSLFSVTRDCRAYRVSKLVNGQWQTLRPWDEGLRVGDSPGAGITIAHLKLVVQGSQFQLYSGGQLMDKVNDPTYVGGQIGLSGGTFGQDVHTSFDNFKIDPLP